MAPMLVNGREVSRCGYGCCFGVNGKDRKHERRLIKRRNRQKLRKELRNFY